MCAVCGCSTHQVLLGAARGRRAPRQESVRYRALEGGERPHDHARDDPQSHEHGRHDPPRHGIDAADPAPSAAALHAQAHGRGEGTLVALERDVLAKNNALAERNRRAFAARNLVVLNLMSSPGSGKTTLLVRTIRELGDAVPMAVLGGDQATDNDVERIAATGCRALQINTGTGCHLDADMVGRALVRLAPPPDSVLMIENVGNLVCPALFDLGERARVVMLSVTEGEDKPLKYPHMFRAARLMLLTKIDLLPHLEFDVERAIACARRVNPAIEVLQLSARSGAGLDAWYGWLVAQYAARRELALV